MHAHTHTPTMNTEQDMRLLPLEIHLLKSGKGRDKYEKMKWQAAH